MRWCLLSLMLMPGFVKADDASDAKAIVEKGIKAAGYDKLKTTNCKFLDKGKLNFGGQSITYDAVWQVAAPGKLRFDMSMVFMGQKVEIQFIMNEGNAWESSAGVMRAVEGEKLKEQINSGYAFYVATLLPLTKDAKLKLATAAGKDVDGKPTAGVTVTSEGKPTITLYFDKATGYLVKSERMVKDEFQNWKEVNEETYYSDYHDHKDGGKEFRKLKVHRDGKPLIESDYSKLEYVEKFEESVFSKPK